MANVNALSAPAAGSGMLHRTAERLKQAWRGYWSNRAVRATVFVLRSLDDRTLKDIGMDRSEIESVVHAHEVRDRRIRVWPRPRP